MRENKEYLEFDEPEHPDKYGNCPDCGCPMNDDNYGGNGYFNNVLLTYSTDFFCKEPKEGYIDQWDTTRQKLAIINGLINQNAEE